MRLTSDRRVRNRVKVCRPTQDLDSNVVFLNFLDSAVEVFSGQILQESDKVGRPAEDLGSQHAPECLLLLGLM